ncbi:signal transducer [Protomyces lactucae-debilis]|uniref:Signal transducer n=1 Tax=Protomyces lactucae-debilis TaxID=2754530 RepID=A0A1Y2FSQ6_PROLT|nr:signal transducer [Protomyces lactucae-debilis]ORY87032.1 signal transducer [Protomyces lactucae-debilis]
MSRKSIERKLITVGDGGCGKTSLLTVYTTREFPTAYVPTVFETYVQELQVGNRHVSLSLWDTAGQEEYDRLRPLSYPETNIILVCFAIDCPPSLENIVDKWYPEVRHFCPRTPLLLVGLKSDLRQNRNAQELLRAQGLSPVTFQQASAVAERMGAQYMECSSKENQGVAEVFELAVDMALSDGSLKRLRKRMCDIV